MGCDIHTVLEIPDGIDRWLYTDREPFDWRYYGLYAFLAGVRNMSEITPISEPRGWPEDIDYKTKKKLMEWKDCCMHSESWLYVKELLEFDYDQDIEDRRVGRWVTPTFFNGGLTCKPGEGRKTTYREFLGLDYFEELESLPPDGRIVFCFDN